MAFNFDNPNSRKVYNDLKSDNTSSQIGLQVPIVDTALVPSPTNHNARSVHPKGKLAADRTDCCLYLSDGKSWNYVGGCAGGNSARVHLAASQAGLTPGSTTILYDTIDSDPSGIYNPATGIFTIPQSGVYHVKATLCLTNPSDLPVDFIGSLLTIDGINFPGIKSVIPLEAASNPADIALATVIDVELALTTGQTLQMLTSTSGGVTTTALGGSNTDGGPSTTWFQLRRVE